VSEQAFEQIDALIQVGLRLARSAPSGRIALARIATAIEPEWIPRPWGNTIVAELEQARKQASKPIDRKQIERTLRDAWGAKPTEELDELDYDPVAITPGAQVHRGVVDGKPVAVKVLRPGLAASVRQDLTLLEGLLAPLGAAFPALDPKAVIREVRERILDELDFEHEASIQRRFHRALRGHPFLTVPAPITRLARDSVLVSEWVEGVPLHSAPDRDQAAARLIVFVLGAAKSGVIHADPDPDDVLLTPDGRLAILDFGAARTVEPERVAIAQAGLEAFIAGDADGLGAAAHKLGWLPAELGSTALELVQYALEDLGEAAPSTLDSPAVVAARDRLFEQPKLLTRLIRQGSLPPEDLWPARGVAQLFGTIAQVGATGAWRELALSAVRDGWSVEA
jgi:predicted unusual protein kinase regulating ubiquinone biosynthesis (AarF/ABC1/UbiB family)